MATFYRMHMIGFIVTGMIGAILIYAFEHYNVSFTDAAFTAFSALCAVGLITLDTSILSTASQTTLFVLIFIGGGVLGSLWLLVLRRFAIRRRSNYFRGELDPCEHLAAVEMVCIICVVYTIMCMLIGFLSLGLYFMVHPNPIFHAEGLNPWWAAAFTAVSAFSNAGLVLFSDNLIQFRAETFVLFVLSVLIMLGNVAYPLVLALVVRVLRRYYHYCGNTASEKCCAILVDFPRECHTHLFPAPILRFLFVVLVITTWVEFSVLVYFNYNDGPALADMSPYHKVVVGLFQSISTRTAGFNTVSIGDLGPAVVVMYIGSMYLASFPVTVAMRSSSHRQRTMKHEAGNMLQSDVLWLFVPWVALCAIHDHYVHVDPRGFNANSILFEVVGGFSTVGLSIGHPSNGLLSMSAQFTDAAKWLMIVVMLVGRHRGLPTEFDELMGLSDIMDEDEEDAEEVENTLPNTNNKE